MKRWAKSIIIISGKKCKGLYLDLKKEEEEHSWKAQVGGNQHKIHVKKKKKEGKNYIKKIN